jgi:hypothetical protein
MMWLHGNFFQKALHITTEGDALDYMNTLDQAEAEGHSWVSVFEDDVILTTRPSEGTSSQKVGR